MISRLSLNSASSLPAAFSLPFIALSFLLGIIFLQLQSELPSIYWIALLPLVLLLSVRWLRFVWLLSFISGFFWAYWFAWSYLQAVPDISLYRQNILVTGVISNLPVKQEKSTKFIFDIENFNLKGYSGPVPKTVRLSWYYADQLLIPGQRWQFIVRLKPPNGFQNPGGFDYEGWLFQQGIHATGYIKKSKLNKKLNEDSWGSYINQVRYEIKRHINAASSEQAALLNALAIGYRGDMDTASWQIFIKTGTNHLMAISGLHIGMVAGFVWFVLYQLARLKKLNIFLNRRVILLLSFSMVLIYAALAGFTIPTQRALIMLSVVYLGLFLYRQLTVVQSLSLALLVVLIIAPTSVLSVGFWLSFLAVGAISYSIYGRLHGRNKALVWIWPQIVVIFSLMPLSFYFFQQSSVIAILANIVAIPLISVAILPVLLIGVILIPVYSDLAMILLNISSEILSYLVMFLEYLSGFEFSVLVNSQPDLMALSLAMLAVILIFSPYAFPAKWLALFLFLPLATGQSKSLKEGALELHVLDVGQGLSVYIQTSNHALLFDTGARFSKNFNVGDKVVLPFLRYQNIGYLDKLIISNGDNDHIGGAMPLIKNFRIKTVLGRDIEKVDHQNKSLCRAGQKWNWDGVDFEILHPENQNYKKRNDYSCVLKVNSELGSVLIAADIEKKAESKLVKNIPRLLKSDVLIVPHHGSKTSSSVAFINAVKPEIAIYSSGYLNRYGFPRPEITQRYSDLGVRQLTTAETGHIKLIFDGQSLKLKPVIFRQQYRRYWHRPTNIHNFWISD